MKILVGISTHSPDLKSATSGSERQALGNATALYDRGHMVQYRNLLWKAVDWEKEDYDIVHLFNANGPNGPYQAVLNEAHYRDIPVILSPIYWPVDEMLDEMMTGGDNEKIVDLYFSSFKQVVMDADVLLPNAEEEMRKVEQFVGSTDLTYQVVPNAINIAEIDRAKPNQAPEEWGNYVLCAGRMEPRKNQHRLIQAMEILWAQGYDLNLVMIGQPDKAYLNHYDDIFSKHEDKIFMSKESLPPKALFSAMIDAELLAMPSWLETPGLVALEAVALGTDVVVTNRGTAGEYFGSYVNYCKPDQPYSIAEAMQKTLKNGNPDELQEIVLDRYNYEKVGELNEKVYQEVL